MNIVVTGVAGFLGSHVARALLDEGHDVAGCDNYVTPGTTDCIPLEVDLTAPCGVQDLRPDARWGAELVVHCAAIARSTWPNEDELWEHNVAATQAVLDWGVPVIHASSSVVAFPDSSIYAKTKAVAERLVLGRPGNLALRFGNIYGPGQSEDGPGTPNVVAAFRRQMRDLGYVMVEGDGLQRRRFVHVTDAGAAVVAAVNSSVRGTWLDICGREARVGEIARHFTEDFVCVPGRANDPDCIPQDPTPAKVLLGWEPTIGLAEGLAEVLRA